MSRKSKKRPHQSDHDLKSREKAAGWVLNSPGRPIVDDQKNSNSGILKTWPSLIVCGFLVLAIVLVYGQNVWHQFINYDDPTYVYANDAIKDGFSWKAVAWSFTTFSNCNWHPITWLSHMLDCQLFGLRPGAHHAVNLALHIINSILLYILLLRITAAQWRSAMVATLFALHPLHVESVAWVAERKDLLSTLFMILTILAYVHYVSRPSAMRYLMVFVLLALGLMSKPMLVTLPFVLLLLDYWPLGRWVRSPTINLQNNVAKTSGRTAVWLVLEKLPLLALAAASSIVTCIAQQQVMPLTTVVGLPMRLTNAMVSYMEYLGKTVWPFPLIIFYPYELHRPWWQPVAAGLVLLFVTSFAIWLWQKHPYLIVGWFWYLGTLVPVIGLVQVGAQAMADRYTYIPLIGIFIVAVWGAADLAIRWRISRTAIGSMAAVVILACMTFTARQVTHWADSMSIFGYALTYSPNNPVAHSNLAFALAENGQMQAAIDHYQMSLRLNPDNPEVQNNLGIALSNSGQPHEAIKCLHEAVRLNPDYQIAHNNLGFILNQIDQPEEAIKHFQEALRVNPDYADAELNLGISLFKTNRLQQAADHFNRALKIQPDLLKAYYNLVITYAKMGRSADAERMAQKTLDLAKFQGQTAMAGQIEDWLKSYQMMQQHLPNLPQSQKFPASPP